MCAIAGVGTSWTAIIQILAKAEHASWAEKAEHGK